MLEGVNVIVNNSRDYEIPIDIYDCVGTAGWCP
jgi:hypothetical protein